MSLDKFKHPPQKPYKPYISAPIKPRQFYDAPNKELARNYNGLTLNELELPAGVSLADLLFSPDKESEYGDPLIIVSYSTGEQVKNKRYDEEMKRYEKRLEENEHKEAVYEAQMANYKTAKKEYDAFWAQQEQQ